MGDEAARPLGLGGLLMGATDKCHVWVLNMKLAGSAGQGA